MADSSYVYDLGHAFVGFVEIDMPVVEEGRKVRFFYEDFYLKDPKDFRDMGDFSDSFIGDGKTAVRYTNKFQYKALRYLKIQGLAKPLDPSAKTGPARGPLPASSHPAIGISLSGRRSLMTLRGSRPPRIHLTEG